MASNGNTPLIKDIAEKQLEQGLQISNLMNEVADLKHGMQRLLFLIDDDHKTGTPGMASQLRLEKNRVDNLVQFKNEVKIIVALIGTFAGVVGNLLPTIIKNFLKL